MVEGQSETSANRRWLIGLSITVLFGVFGAVMAYLAYADRNSSRPAASSPASKPASEPASEPGPGDKGQGHKDK
ncbi:MAG: hypothetical protein H0T42_27770 [Deltaproteobacteria bacterium]|nr:hypothetical protein [Deltaproteobacteria bacterium]